MYKNYISLSNSGSTTLSNSVKSGVSTLFGGLAAWQKKAFLALLFAMFSIFGANAQIGVTITGNTNTTPNLAATYTSVANFVTALNTVTAVSGSVTATLAAGASETAPIKGFNISTSTANVFNTTNKLTIVKASGAATTINAAVGTASPTSVSPDGMMYLSGMDGVTIDGITFTDGNTASATVAMEYGIALFKRAAGDGCNGNTIQNCIFNMQRINNTAGTSPMIEGAVGILVINSTAAAATTSLTPTNGGTLATNGTNSGNKFYSNTINGGNYGIGLSGFAASAGVGPTPTATSFLGDLGNDVGGTGASGATTGNSILNFGGGAATNPSAGIRANNQWSLNVGNNTVNNNNGSGTNHATTLRGIYLQAGTSASVTCTYNNVTIKGGATTSTITAIDNGIGGTASSNTVNINNNTIQNCAYATATSGALTLISNTASAATVNINNNILGTLTYAATTGVFTAISNSGSTGTTLNVGTNTIGSITLNSSGTHPLIVVGSPGGTANVTNNTIQTISCTATSGTLRAITATTPVGLYSVTGNTIDGLSYTAATSTGSIDGIYNNGSATLQNWNGNILRNLSTPTTGTIRGIFHNTATGTHQVKNNQVYNFSTTAGGAGGASFTGIASNYGTADVSGNLIYSLNSTGSTGGTAGTIYGLSISGTTQTVYNNAIYDLSSNSTNVTVAGINISGGTTNNVYNNLIGDLRAPFSTGNVSISGIISAGGTTNNIYHNTVNLAATTSSASTFGTSAIYFSSSTPVNNLRNNLFVNTSAAGPTGGITAAIRYTIAPTSTNFPAANNNNVYYAGTPAANKLIYTEGGAATATNGQQTIAAYKSYINTTLAVAGREGLSNSVAPTWQSTTGSNPITNFLKYSTSVATPIEQGGGTGTSITTDFTGTTLRCPNGACPGTASLPDIGAWELAGSPLPACTAPSAQPTAMVLSAATTTATVSFTAATGTPDGYLVIRTTTSTAPTNPTDGTNYSGTALGGTVVSTGALVSISDTGLTASTAYWYWVYPFNSSSSCAGPVYYTGGTILSGTISTCGVAPVSSAATSIGGTGFTANWGASAGATSYILDISTSNTFATFVSGYNGTNVGNVLTLPITGLTALTTYYYRVRATNGSCTTSNSATITASTLGAIPWTEGFATTTLPNGWTNLGTIGTTTGVAGNPGNAMYKNMWSSATTGTFTMPTFAAIPANCTFSYDYKITDYGLTTATASGWGNFQLQISVNGGAFSNLGSSVTAASGTNYVTRTVDLSAYSGSNIQLKVNATWSTGDYNLAFDNFSILAPCAAPVAPTALTQGTTGPGSITESFTPNATAPDGYMVVRYPTGSGITAPTNGTTTYAIGQALGSGIISNVLSSAATTFTITGLAPTTGYDIYVYPYTINSCIGGPVFGTALSGTNHITSGCPTLSSLITVGASGADYTKLGDAILVLNGCPVSSATTVRLNTDYVPAGETFPITINTNSGASATNTITIVPQTGSSAIAWSGSSTSALLDFSGASYYTLDGRPGGSGSTNGISITNTGNGPAMRLINDAKNNTIQYTNLAAANTSNTSGVVRITTAAGSTASNGNSNNTISYCNIDGTGVSPNGIYAAGSASPADNKSNTISNNNIFNYYADPTGGSSNFGIFMAGGNGVTASASWTISGNSFYQTATRTYANAVATNYISAIGGPFSSNGYNFTGNYIGGTAANCGGTAMTINGTGAHSFMPIQALFGGADNNTVSNNTIQNINVTTASVNNNNAGIVIAAFNAAATHAITNNTIGSTATNGSISFTGGSASTFSGIMLGSTYTGQTATAINVTGNTIAGINLPSASTNNFTGILEYSNTNLALSALSSIASNTIGGTSTGVISNASLGTAMGISYAHQTGATITSNTIQNMSIANAASTAALMGINVSAGAVTSTINGNTIANLSTNSANTTATASPAIAGIQNTAAIASISNNTINSLTASANAANTIHGIYNAGTVSAVNANLVYGLSSSNASATAAIMNGFYINGGTSNYNNNVVRLGTVNPTIAASIHGIFNSSGTNTNNFYFNSIYIGGSAVGTTASDTYAFRSGGAGNRTIQNNIFVNARSNGSTGGKHYAIRVAGTTVNPTGLILNNNDYLVSGTGGTFGFYNSLDVASLSAWKTAVGLDSSSFSADPYFNGATSSTPDLSINTTPASVLESQATPIAGITTDYSGATRNASTPDIGAYEFAGTSAVPTLSITSIAPSTTQCVNTARLVTVDAVAGGTTLVSGMVTLSYSINGATATVVNMNNTSGTTWTYSIPVVTPEAASITWTVNVNDGTYSITKTGASYQDNPLINYTANLAASTNALCSGSPLTLTATVTPPGTATYCSPTVPTNPGATGDYITGVVFAGISNTGTDDAIADYTDYSGTQVATVVANGSTSYNYTVTVNDTSQSFRIWIDFNQNGTFEASESVASSASGSTTFTGSFTIPNTALNGTTRMRVGNRYSTTLADTAACSNPDYGEYEDYSVIISGGQTNILLPTAYEWFDGATSLGTSSTNTFTPDTTVASTATKVYSATYTAQGCTKTITTTQSVVVTALPTAPTITDSTQCGTTVPTCSAAGGTTGQYRWYTVSTGGTPIAGETASTLSTYVVSTSSTLYVAINNGTCESARTAVSITVNTPPTLSVTANQTICNGAVGTLAVTSTLGNYDTYTWSPVTNLFTNNDGTGAYVAYTNADTVYVKSTTASSTTYTLNASMSTGPSAGCSATATTTVVILPNPTVTTGTDTYCLTGTPSVALSTTTGYTGGSIAWAYSTNGTSYTPIGGATLATYTAPSAITASTYFQATIKDGTGATCSTPSTLITVNNPSVTGTSPNTRCGTGTVALGATGSAGATLNWFANATGGTALGTGTSFTTPSIAATTTYYVDASAGGGGAETVGVALPNNSDGSFITTGWGVVFNATSAFTLNSVVVYPTGTGTITIQLVDSTGAEIQSTAAISLTGTGVNTSPVTLPLGFTVPIGTGYRLQVKAYTGITGLMRGSTGVTYPYTSASASVTGGYFGSVTTTNYFFYNLNLSTGCVSASRTAVTATITSPPGLAISSPSATICAGASTTTPVTVTSTVADFDTYTWSPTTVSGDTSGYTFTPVAASGVTTYTLSASNAAGCSNTATFNVTVNPAPSFSASASPATICNGAISTLTAVLPATANTYTFASTTGGTLDTMSGATSIFSSGIDNTASALTTFPSSFVFKYEGINYTDFTVSDNGVLKLAAVVSTSQYGTITSANVLTVLGQDMSTGSDGAVVYVMTGTAPNRIFKVQWKTVHNWTPLTNPINNTYQMWLYEDGRIQYVYGALASTTTPAAGIGICGASTANYKSVNVTAGTVSSAAVTSNSTLPTSGTVYTFTPPVTSSVSWTPITTLYTNNTATTSYTSLANTLTVYAKPTSVGLNNYVALATDLVTSCTATQTVGVTVTALPTAPVAHDAHQCGAGVPAAYVSNPNTFSSISAPVYNVYADNNPATAVSYSTTTPTALSSISATTTLYISIVSPDTGCESARTAVTATVDTMPSATISYANTPFCASTTTGTAVTLTSPTGTGSATGTYSSTTGLAINASTGAIDPTTSTAGPYTVTYTMDGGGCGTQTATTSVTVNAVPNSGFSYSASNYCTSGGTTSPTITGTAGTFTASPSGLSINATTGVINLAASAAGTYDITNTVSAGGCSNSVTTVTGVTITTAVNITTQPSSVSKLPGQTASFTVAATGTGTLTYQWQYSTGSGWFDLSNTGVYSTTATTTLNISDVTGLDGYQYRAMVTGTSPCAPAPSDAATLTVNTISFTLQPATQTICSDSGVTFSITTTGGTPSTYHWQYRTSALGTFADLADSATISGANTATLTISAGFGFTSANTGNQYRCVVDQYISPISSAVATLTVNDLPAFSTPLASQTVCTSVSNVTFTANATGTGLSYQWEVYTATTPTWTAISSATASTYEINSPTTALSGNQYRVVVTGLAPAPCNTPITSAVATLTVNQAVAIGTNPTAQVLCPTTTANFSVASVTGDGIAYQWYATNGGAPIALSNGATGSGATVSGATSASLSVATPLEFNNYSFYCVVSGIAPCSVATSTSALLTLYNKATYSIGAGGDFTNLTTAIAQLQTCGITQATALELNASYNGSNEPAYPVVLPAISGASATNTLTIREASGVSGKVLNNASITPTALATIDMNAGTYWIIDGRVGGTGSTKDLQITNSNLSGAAIRFINDASYNTVKYVDISGVNNTTTGGVVLFSTATTTGNDFNTVDNCNIRSAATTPVNGVYAAGTAAKINDNNTLSNNNVYDYFSATLVTNGINIASNSGVWSITGNRLYQTANRVYTTANTHNGINIATGDGYTISGNIIGYANASGTGSTNMVGLTTGSLGGTFPSAYTVGGTANATRYIAINAAFTAAGTVSNIQNNTIAGFALYTSSGAATSNGVFCGINVTAGNVNIGTTTGNTIGATSGNSSVYVASTTAGAQVVGIYTTSANTVAIQNNTFGAIDASGTSATTRAGFTGIDTAGAANYSITNNTIGNADATNIRSGYFVSGSNLTNSNGTATSTTGATAFMMGIRTTMTGNVLAITGNTLRGWATSGTVTPVTGISTSGTMTGTTPTMDINTNNLGTSSRDFMTYSVANSGALAGITSSSVATTSNVNGNDIRGIVHSVAGSSAHTYINYTGGTAASNVSSISNNTFTNLNVNTTGSVVFLSHNYSIAATGAITLNSNSIVTGYTKASAGGTNYIDYTNGSSVTGAINNFTNNNFSNITLTGATALTGVQNTDGGTGATLTFTGNTFNNWTSGAGALIGFNMNYWNGTSSLSNNTITNITGQSSINAINIGSTVSTATLVTVSGNTITGLVSTGTGGSVIGLSCSNTSTAININGNTINTLTSTSTPVTAIAVTGATTTNVYSNTINTLSSSNASGVVNGITATSGTAVNVYGNTINTLSASGATTPVVNGVAVSGGTTVKVYKNKVYDLLASGAFTTTGAVNGMLFSAGTTVSAFNNLVGDLRATAANSSDAIRGISVTSTSTSTTYNLYNNTIYLNATSSGTAFGTTGIYHTTSTTATTAKLDLQNNIVINTSTPGSTGVVTALRRSSTTLTNFATTSNRNMYFAGTAAANRTIMTDATNFYQTIGVGGTYNTAVSTREANSFTETGFSAVAFFTATTGSSSTYLQPNTGIVTLAESGGNTQALFTDDFNSQTRPVSPGTAYDLGAWEFAGTTTAPVVSFSSATPVLTTQCTAAARSIALNITTAGGTITTTTLNYSFNGTAQTPITTPSISGSVYTFSVPVASPANATVAWSVTALSSLGYSTTYTGTTFSDAPLTGTTATAAATLTTVCSGSPTELSATLTKAKNATIGLGASTSSGSGGSGATYASPFTHYYGGLKAQYLVKASELSTAGLNAGALTSMAFDVTSAGTAYTGYTINIGTTTSSALTTTFVTDLTQVYTVGSTGTSTPTVGINTYTFGTGSGSSSSIIWNGTDNLVVEIIWSNNNGGGTAAEVKYDTTSYVSLSQYHVDDTDVATVSGTTTALGTASFRPKMVFVGNGAPSITNYSWATSAVPGTEIGSSNNLSVSPTTTTSYVVTVTASGCTVASSPLTVTVNPTSVGGTVSSDQAICTGTAPASLTLTGNTGTVTKWQKSLTTDFASATDIAGTSTTLSGATIGSLTATTYFRAVVQSGTGIGACATANSAYATVTVNPTSVGGTVAGNQTICAASSPSTDLTLSSNTGDVVKWQKSLTTDFASATDITSTSATLTGATIGNLSATTYFRAVVQSGACAPANSTNYVTVTVNTTVAGAVSGGAATCSGSTSGLLTVADYTGSIVRWESSVSPFTTWTTIANTASTYTSGALTETTQFRAVINNGSCGEANATPTTVTIESTTWDGTAWSNGSPSSVKAAIIAGNLTTAGAGAGDLTACSLTVNAGYTVVVTSGDDFNISGAVNVNATATLTFNNNANLLQGTTATTNTNSGSITSKRNATMRRLEYIYWSAPVANQNLLSFSPLTLSNRFYTFDEPTNVFVAVASPSTTVFGTSESQIAGKGFMIRAPNTFLDAPAAPQTFNGSFAGVPNNGTYTTPVSNSGTNHGYNLIGNPYPSPIDADLFLAANPGTLYFWTHAIIGSGGNNYASYTAAGATAAAANGASCNGTIQTGQGFLILTTTNGNATFTNAMRLGNNSGQFFKTASTEKHRIWLNLNSATATFNQIMVGYIEGATQGFDTSIDGSLLPYGSSALSSRIDNADYVIQGRALPFASADTVPLGFNAAAAGEFTISIDHVDGLFLGSQDIYLKDNLLGITYNIKANPYTFTSASGVFNNRFEIVYTSSPLGTHNPTFDSESVVVYKQNQVLNVNSGTTVMAKVRVFDVRGRLIFEKNNINATAVKLTDLKAEQQVLMVQITSDDNRVVTKKVVY